MNEERARALVRRLLRAVRNEEDEVSYGMMTTIAALGGVETYCKIAPGTHLSHDLDAVKYLSKTNPHCYSLGISRLRNAKVEPSNIFAGIVAITGEDNIKEAYEKALNEGFSPMELIDIALARKDKIGNIIPITQLLPSNIKEDNLKKFLHVGYEKMLELGYSLPILAQRFESIIEPGDERFLLREDGMQEHPPDIPKYLQIDEMKDHIQFILDRIVQRDHTAIHKKLKRLPLPIHSKIENMRLRVKENMKKQSEEQDIDVKKISKIGKDLWSNTFAVNLIRKHLEIHNIFEETDQSDEIKDVRHTTAVIFVLLSNSQFTIPDILKSIEAGYFEFYFRDGFANQVYTTDQFIGILFKDDAEFLQQIESYNNEVISMRRNNDLREILAWLPNQYAAPTLESSTSEAETSSVLYSTAKIFLMLCIALLMAYVVYAAIAAMRMDKNDLPLDPGLLKKLTGNKK